MSVDARPATKVDGVLIFAGGYVRRLTLRERIRWMLGGLPSVKR